MSTTARRSVPLLIARYVMLAGIIVVLNFLLPRMLPGDPLAASLNGGLDAAAPMSADDRARLSDYYHLTQPVSTQFRDYLTGLVHGDLGWSISHSHPVATLIMQRLPWTLGMMLASLLVAAFAGTAAGVAATWFGGGRSERTAVSVGAAVAALPEFLVAIVLLLIFAIGLNWLPLGGGKTVFQVTSPGVSGDVSRVLDILKHMILPVLALSLAGAAGFVLIAHDVTVGMRGAAWLSLARAKGLRERDVVTRHVLPNIAMPLLTFFGLRVGAIFGGALVIEKVFNLPGLGQLAFEAVQARDYPVLQAVFLLSALAVLAVNLCLELIYLRAAPRGQMAAGGGQLSAKSARPGRPLTFYLGCVILIAAAAVALFASRIAPFDPHLPVGTPLIPPTSAHWLGTNDLGQDQLSQLIYGARTTLMVASVVVAISAVMSWLVGLGAGFFPRAEGVLLTLVDVLLALPSIPLYLLIMSLLGASRWTLVLMLGFLSWPAYARIVRSLVLQTRSAPYIEAARANGASDFWIVRRHILPATLDVLPAKLALTLRFAIFAEATLAFLGLGATGSLSWGTMLSWAFSDPLLFSRGVWPWLVFPPATAIVLLILASVWITGGVESRRRGADPNVPAPSLETRSQLPHQRAETAASVSQVDWPVAVTNH